MTANQFARALKKLGLSTQAAAAEALGVTQSRISEWTSGRYPVPPYIERSVSALLELEKMKKRAAA